MAGPILSFSDSEGSDNEVIFKKKANNTTFRKRGFKPTKKLSKDTDSVTKVNISSSTEIPEAEAEAEAEADTELKFKKNSVRFQLNEVKQTPLSEDTDIKKVLNQYGAINIISDEPKNELDDNVEGFYLEPSSESEVEDYPQNALEYREEDSTDINIKAIENQLLKEEFITEDISKTKRTRAVLEKDHEGLQLDQGSNIVDDELLPISINEKKTSEKERQRLIQEALENVVHSDEAESVVEDDSETVDLIVNENVTVTCVKFPEFESSSKKLQARLEKLHALRSSQSSKREHFSKELEAIEAKQKLDDIIDFARLNIIT